MDISGKGNKRNIQPFNGEKYGIWKFRIKAYLTELDVLEVIITDAPTERTRAWTKKEVIAKSTIIEYLGDSFLHFAKEEVSAKEILQQLDSIYERRSLATQLALRKRLLSLKLQGDMSLLQHFTLFDEIVNELSAAGARFDEMDKISHLLITLPTSYDGVITAIETIGEQNLTLAFVKIRLLDHEVKLKADDGLSSQIKILYNTAAPPVQQKSQKEVKPNNNRFFRASEKKPWGMKQNYNRSNYKTTNQKCYHCGRRNHLKRDCIYYKRMINEKQSENVSTIQTLTADEGYAFMFDHHQGEKQDKTNTINFMVDSGATEDIINSAE